MSDRVLSWAFQTTARPARTKLVLVALAKVSNETGQCAPLLTTISGMTSMTEKAVDTALADLTSAGLITSDGEQITLRLDEQPATYTKTVPPPDAPLSAQLKAFEAFWERYPKKTGQSTALRAWAGAIRSGVPAVAIIDPIVRMNAASAPAPAYWIAIRAVNHRAGGAR